MAQRRDYRAEYRRRVRRAGGGRALYRQRLERAGRAHPGVGRAQARGHGGLGKIEQARKALRAAGPDGLVDFVAYARDPTGQFHAGELTVFDGVSRSVVFEGDRELTLLPELVDVVDASPVKQIGGVRYLRRLAGWVSTSLPFLFRRGRRYLRLLSKSGAALTTARRADATTVAGLDAAAELLAGPLAGKGFLAEPA